MAATLSGTTFSATEIKDGASDGVSFEKMLNNYFHTMRATDYEMLLQSLQSERTLRDLGIAGNYANGDEYFPEVVSTLLTWMYVGKSTVPRDVIGHCKELLKIILTKAIDEGVTLEEMGLALRYERERDHLGGLLNDLGILDDSDVYRLFQEVVAFIMGNYVCTLVSRTNKDGSKGFGYC